MIAYVDLEHERMYRPEAEVMDPGLPGTMQRACAAATLVIKYRLEALTGQPCLIVHHSRLTPALLRELGVRAAVVSGNLTGFEHYPEESLAGLRATFREVPCPILAICGGHQLLAQTYGAEIGPMGTLPFTITDPYVDTPFRGLKQERGFAPLRIRQAHPLLHGLGPEAVFFFLHYWEVKAVPAGFEMLAESEACAVQVLAHTHLPLFSTQFHPERYDDAHPDGQTLLHNFFHIAGVI